MALRGRATLAHRTPEIDTQPWRAHEWFTGFPYDVPDPIEWVVSDKYLNRPNLYPRQATILKIVFLRDDMFTQYDHDVIGGWTQSFEDSGNHGIQTDIYERIRLCKEEGRPWFRESVVAIGRRGSKGHLGGLAGSYVLWNYMSRGDPQGHYGIDRDKQLACFVFGGKKEQARVNQWADLVNVITGSNCFTGGINGEAPNYIPAGQPLAESLSVYSPHDFWRRSQRRSRGIEGRVTPTFLIEPKESTPLSGRGPASFMQFYDEMAHVVKQVAKADAADVYGAAKPALDTFGVDAFLWEPSSTWQMAGQFYENWSDALELLEDGTPARPEMLMLQLTSWDPYVDWERADQIPMWPGGPTFRPLRTAIQSYDDQMKREERANYDTFRVERLSHWAAVLDAYLPEDHVDRMFEPWRGEKLQMKDRGLLAVAYKAHGDPSRSGANFGFAIAHPEMGDDGFVHCVFDLITHWEPTDFPDNNNQIDYVKIGTEHLPGFLDTFMPDEMTFDQWNSAFIIDWLKAHVRKKQYPKRVTVFEKTATAPYNWERAETFKTGLGMNLIHAPWYEQAEQELKFLQKTADQKVDHPTSGPVQTKDVADCLMECAQVIIGEQVRAFLANTLSQLPVGAAQSGGFETFPQATKEAQEGLSRFGRQVGRRNMHAAPRQSSYRRR